MLLGSVMLAICSKTSATLQSSKLLALFISGKQDVIYNVELPTIFQKKLTAITVSNFMESLEELLSIQKCCCGIYIKVILKNSTGAYNSPFPLKCILSSLIL